MRQNLCPKCGQTFIDTGRLMSAGGVTYKSDKHRLVIDSNTRSRVCMNCGYVETYVDQVYLEKVRRKYEQA